MVRGIVRDRPPLGIINPCCFGEDVAAWLREALIAQRVEVGEPYQEDWGWEMRANDGSGAYYLSLSGNADEPERHDDEGEWRIIVQKRRSAMQRLSGTGNISEDDKMTARIMQILAAEPEMRDVRREG